MTTSIFFPSLFCIPLLSSTPGFPSVNPNLKLSSPLLFISLFIHCSDTHVSYVSYICRQVLYQLHHPKSPCSDTLGSKITVDSD